MKNLLFVFTFFLALTAQSQTDLEVFIYQQQVDSLIKWVENKNVEKIADKVIYPLDREYPLPDIQNSKEFISYYDTIFDDSIKSIITSATSNSNWTNMKAKGVKLNSGILWFSHNIYFSVINYYSKTELIKREKLLSDDKNSIHPSLREFDEPIMKFKTHKHIIRIDRMNDNSFRYCAWSLTDSTSNKPKFIIYKGLEFQSHSELCPYYQFKSNGLTYNIYAGCLVSGYGFENLTPEQTGMISILQNGREIRKEQIVKLKR
jgi:hypothetical protein